MLLLLCCAVVIGAQSGSQNFPTPLRSNELSGTIAARDIGDSRLTTHYYTFVGNQGDIFINVVTGNFDGDIDVFTADTLKPLTKIVVYSDAPDSETGRVIYLRQNQKLILRIEGRSPNDKPATYRLKFAGSFAPSEDAIAADDPTVKAKNEDADVKVNSAGTIVAVRPKPTPTPAEAESVPKSDADKKPEKSEVSKNVKPSKQPASTPNEPRPEVVVTDPLPADPVAKPDKVAEPDKRPTPKPQTRPATKPVPKTELKPPPKSTPSPEPDPLANVRLIVLFKDGSRIERPMTEIIKLSIDKGILTIINKNGSIGRYKLTDIAKMTVE